MHSGRRVVLSQVNYERPRLKGVRAIGASACRSRGIRVDQRKAASDVQLSCRIHQLLVVEYPFGRAVELFCGSHHQITSAPDFVPALLFIALDFAVEKTFRQSPPSCSETHSRIRRRKTADWEGYAQVEFQAHGRTPVGRRIAPCASAGQMPLRGRPGFQPSGELLAVTQRVKFAGNQHRRVSVGNFPACGPPTGVIRAVNVRGRAG